ncbi:MAG TPA: hypothetical protein VGE02_10160 [Gemmatimonadales bacterium]
MAASEPYSAAARARLLVRMPALQTREPEELLRVGQRWQPKQPPNVIDEPSVAMRKLTKGHPVVPDVERVPVEIRHNDTLDKPHDRRVVRDLELERQWGAQAQ